MKLFACLFTSLLLMSLTACGNTRVSPMGVSTNRLTAASAGNARTTSTPPAKTSVSAQTYSRTVVTPVESEESEETTHPASLTEEDTWE